MLRRQAIVLTNLSERTNQKSHDIFVFLLFFPLLDELCQGYDQIFVDIVMAINVVFTDAQ